MNDGTYSPIAMMKPQDRGPFPLAVIAHMNGGGGTEWLRVVAIRELDAGAAGESRLRGGADALPPAAGDYLAVGRRPAGSPQIPETRMNITQQMLDEEKAATRARIDMMNVAMERINRIKTPILVMGRINDNNEPQLRLAYELAKEAGKPVEWKQYEHPEHGFIFVTRNAKGVYDPDPTHKQIVADTIAHFNGCLK